jgi:transposase
MFSKHVGIDISKNWFDIHLDHKVHRVLQKDASNFIQTYGPQLIGALCVMESTGGYEIPLAQALARQGISVHIAHPNQVAAFMRAKNRLAKTDAIDARLLSEFGAFLKGDQIRSVATESQLELTQLWAHITQLKETIHQHKCRTGHPNKGSVFLQASSQRIVDLLEQELASCEKEMLEKIKADSRLKRTFEVLTSMPGVGLASAVSILADLSEIGDLSKKEVAALVGVAPITNESGVKRGQARIRYGRANVRKVLYMAALVACRHNSTMKAFYERLLANGKPKKVAIIAVLRKMIVTLNAMVKTDTVWKNS